jgi:hypothetical protein
MKDFSRMFGIGRSHVPDGTENIAEESGASDKRVIHLRPTILADMANALWAIQQKSCDPMTSETREEFRGVSRHIERMVECLSEIGIEVQTHTNQPFDSGLSLEVIAFQPTPGIVRELVTETIRPTVYLQGHRLQIGQVIVATPEKASTEKD